MKTSDFVAEEIYLEQLITKNKDKFLYDMNGLETWKQVIINQPKVIKNVLEKAKIRKDKIDLFIFHQANKNLLNYLSNKLGIEKDKTYTTVEKYGNTADASIAITLNDALKRKNSEEDQIFWFQESGRDLFLEHQYLNGTKKYAYKKI